MFVKICGLSDDTGIRAAVEAGANAIGFVFADSVREVTPARAAELCRELPSDIIRVAVMRHPSRRRFEEVVRIFDPDWIQTDAGDLPDLPVPDESRCLPVYRDGQLTNESDLPPRLLFEGRVSGSGKTADWDEARRIAGRTELVLAGGLNPDNVQDAIRAVAPFGVDVSSGVESGRGIKDADRIRKFVARVRAWEQEQ